MMKGILRTSALAFGLGVFVCASLVRGAAQDSGNTSPPAPQPLAPTDVPTDTTPPSPATPGTLPGDVPKSPTEDLWKRYFLTGNWGGFRDTLKDRGVAFTPTYTGEVFGNPIGGARQGTIADGAFELPLNIDLDPLTHGVLKDTIFRVNAIYTYGSNLSAQYVHDFSITSNLATYNSLRLQELWAQKLFLDKKLSVKVGNIAVDNEFFQSNSASLFISGTFGAFTLLVNNVPEAPTYPLASPGVRLQYLPTAQTYVMAGVFGQDRFSNPATNNQAGTRFALDGGSGMLVLTETGFLLNQRPNDQGLQGSYRLGAFVDTDDHTTFASQAAVANGTGPRQSAGTNFGIYGVLDQQVYSQDSRIISYFVRSGGAPSDTNFVDYYIESGFNFTGFTPGRANDVAGIAMARSHVSEDYSNAQVAQGNRPSTAETVIEATYKVQLAPWWNVQPDVQYIITPSGIVGSHDALVLGVRTSVAF